jgi:polyisoprenoid-binding protein YceI
MIQVKPASPRLWELEPAIFGERPTLHGGNPRMKWTILPGLLALMAVPSVSLAAAPVFAIVPNGSSVTFHVDASIKLQGRFDRWTGSLTFTSPDISTGVFKLKIDADSVDTGSGKKNGVLKGKKFFDVKNTPFITFTSTKITQTGPNTFAVPGVFVIRSVSKPQTLLLTTTGRGGSSGEIKGTMTFNRKDYGMSGGIPFVRISDHVDFTVDLRAARVSGPPLALTP